MTRDSVAIGDDINAPHSKQVEVDGEVTSLDLAREIQAMGYLAIIGSGEATWSIVAGKPIAIIAQQWEDPKLIQNENLTLRALANGEDLLNVHINYHCQEEPDEILEKLRSEDIASAT